MNITLLVNYDLASVLALNYLLPKLCDPQTGRPQHQLSVFYTRKNPPPNTPAALAALADFEQRQLAQLQSPGDNEGMKDFAELQHYTCNPIVQLNAVNTADIEALRQTYPELIVSIRHMTILREPVIQLPRHGVINLHSGLLPAYQGVMASFRAMLDGQSVLGTTLHHIEDAGIDTGALIKKIEVPCQPEQSYFWNVLNLYKPGCAAIMATINAIQNRLLVPRIPQSGTAHYYGFPTMIELQRFSDSGYCLYRETDIADFNTLA